MASLEHFTVTGAEITAHDDTALAASLGAEPEVVIDTAVLRLHSGALAEPIHAELSLIEEEPVERPGSISVVMGAYNEESVLRGTVTALLERLRFHPGSEVIVVENGSTDGTGALARALEHEFRRHAVPVRAATTSKGLGIALRKGIMLARGDRILITGADLPFGFSDLDAALALDRQPRVVLGSKAHPESLIEVGLGRRILSSGYRMLRRRVLNIGVRDPQGSILIDRHLAQALLPRLRADGYFIETELVVRAAHLGYDPVEVPVRYLDPRTDSKVRPVRDSWDMLRSMFRLRSELRRERRAATAPGPRPVSVT